MATNESIISNGQAQTTQQAADLEVELSSFITELQDVADLAFEHGAPFLGYAQTITALAEYTTTITADFLSGLTYPEFDDIIDAAKLNTYDSEFLQYLEDSLTSSPTAAWASALNTLRIAYNDATTLAGQTFVSTIIPSLGNDGNTYASAMLSQVDDNAAIESAESTLLWNTIAQDLLVEFQQKANESGISIEQVRAGSITQMLEVYTDYYNAILFQAQVNLKNLRLTADQIRQQIMMQIEAATKKSDRNFDYNMLQNRIYVTQLDTDISQTRDAMRRAHTDYQLQLGKAEALVSYIGSAMAQSALSGTFHGNYTSGSEA